MPLQPVYLIAIKNLRPFLEALRHAQAPEKVALKFIEELGFKSTNDRLFLPLLKAMKFLDESGKPTARYHAFLDDEESKRVLTEGVRDAYADLFRINKNAHTFTREQLTGKLKSLGEGKLSLAVVQNMAKTFVELVKLADFAGTPALPSDVTPKPANATDQAGATTDQGGVSMTPDLLVPKDDRGSPAVSLDSLVYRIEIVLPSVRDQAVYDAIFRSLRTHLLR